jgi:putative endonuclease
MFYVYIIFSEELDLFYKGFSTDPQSRLQKHNAGGSTYTSRANDWRIVFLKEFRDQTKALKFEKMLKRQNRKYLEWLIQSDTNLLNDS